MSELWTSPFWGYGDTIKFQNHNTNMYGLSIMFNTYCDDEGTRWREIDMIEFH